MRERVGECRGGSGYALLKSLPRCDTRRKSSRSLVPARSRIQCPAMPLQRPLHFHFHLETDMALWLVHENLSKLITRTSVSSLYGLRPALKLTLCVKCHRLLTSFLSQLHLHCRYWSPSTSCWIRWTLMPSSTHWTGIPAITFHLLIMSKCAPWTSPPR